MAQGTKIDELFISLGLDLSQLDKDFITADKTVSQGIQELSRKQNQTKLRMEIDMSQFHGAENSAQALALKTQYLNQQMEIQKSKVALVNAEYLQSVKAKGADAAASQRMFTNLLREQKAEAELATQIRSTNVARTSGGGLLSGVTGNATSAINGATAGFAAMQARLAGVMAIAVAGAGLFEVVKGATAAGNAVYQMSTKLNISAAEAADLNRILKMGDVDSQTFISTIIRLDRAVETAGKSGNATTNALKEFGISLTDSNNKLLPVNQQLDQLAQGYANAAKAGEEEAYVSEVLGARGQALIPILQQYNDLKEASSRVTTTGLIDPKASRELEIELKVLQMEATQLSNAFGAALIPVAKEVAPMIIDAMKSMISTIKDNKDEIIGVSEAIGDVIRAGGRLAGASIGSIFETMGQKGLTLKNILEDVAILFDALSKRSVLNLGVGIKEAKEDFDKYKQTQKDVKDLQGSDADWVNRQLAAQKEASSSTVKAKQVSAEKITSLENEVYRATHTAYENQIKDIKDKADAMKDAGISETKIADYVAAETAKANQKQTEEEQKKASARQQIVLSVYGTALQQRIAQIDEEKEKYIQAGIEEAQAREMVEKQKADAIRDYTEKSAAAMRNALTGGFGSVITEVQQAILKGKDAQSAYVTAMEKYKKELSAYNQAYGITARGQGWSQDMVEATKRDPQRDLQKAMADYRQINPENNYGVEVLRGTVSSMGDQVARKMTDIMTGEARTATRQGNIITVSPTININSPKVDSEKDIAQLADKVADVITPAIKNAIGGSDNSY